MDNASTQKRPEMDLVNIINEIEGLAWILNHDSADGKIPDKGVDDFISRLIKQKNEAVAELMSRTGFQTYDGMRAYIRGKLKEQDQLWDRQWGELYQEGAVFKISGGGRYRSDITDVFETVRAYLPTSETVGPNQIILARLHGSSRYSIFDDRDIPELTKLEDVQPQCRGKAKRGIIKATEEMANREVARHQNNDGKSWYQFSDTGAVFTHAGFSDIFESFRNFNLPDRKRRTCNEVILARSYSQPVFVEFTPRDLGAMELVAMTPRYTRREGNTIYSPELTLER